MQTKKVNYVVCESSYCHRLAPRLKQLYFFYKNKKFNTQDMRNKVYEIVQGATLTNKMSTFLNKVANIENKRSLYFLCHNSVRKARQTVVERPVKS